MIEILLSTLSISAFSLLEHATWLNFPIITVGRRNVWLNPKMCTEVLGAASRLAPAPGAHLQSLLPSAGQMERAPSTQGKEPENFTPEKLRETRASLPTHTELWLEQEINMFYVKLLWFQVATAVGRPYYIIISIVIITVLTIFITNSNSCNVLKACQLLGNIFSFIYIVSFSSMR